MNLKIAQGLIGNGRHRLRLRSFCLSEFQISQGIHRRMDFAQVLRILGVLNFQPIPINDLTRFQFGRNPSNNLIEFVLIPVRSWFVSASIYRLVFSHWKTHLG